MKIAMSVIRGGKLYYRTIPSGEEIKVKGLDKPLEIKHTGSEISILIKEHWTAQVMRAQLNKPISVETDVMLCFAEVTGKAKRIHLPKKCTLGVGRSDKPSAKGYENDVFIKLPFVSGHHLRLERDGERTIVEDLGSLNGTYLNGVRIKRAQMKDGDVLSILTVRITLKEDRLLIENVPDHLLSANRIKEPELRKAAEKRPVSERGYWHSRAPRLAFREETGTVEITRSPSAGGAPQINWFSVLVTPMISVALMLVMVFVMGTSAMMLIMSGVMSVLSAVAAIVSYKKQKAKFGESSEAIERKYRKYLEGISAKIEAAHAGQMNSIQTANPSPSECLHIAEERNGRLWERTPEDRDFLCVRIGTGEIDANMTASYKREAVILVEEPLENEAVALAQKSRTLKDAPIMCDIHNAKYIGVVGEREAELQLLRTMLVGLATTHSCDELKIVVIAAEAEAAQWSWLRWLPHCADDQNDKRFVFAGSENDEEILVDKIGEEIRQRQPNNGEHGNIKPEDLLPHYLFVIADRARFEKSWIRKVLSAKEDLGASCIYVYDSHAKLPKRCQEIISVSQSGGEAYQTKDMANKTVFRMDEFSLEEAETFARTLSPVEVESVGASVLPQSISFLAGYGVNRPEELNIENRWKKARPYKSVAVPIAAMSEDGMFEFDIHPKYHGTHGMVVGTTGCGKTEMMQAWLLSLAVNYSPEDISFALIDFKGTSMVAPFEKLPHYLKGVLTNLDFKKEPYVLDRAMMAIRSEILRREEVLAKYEAKNIWTLNEQYAKGLVPEKLPILIFVIDEFAMMKNEYPKVTEFVDEVAAVGRALGVWMILMTQTPEGVISQKSENNFSFRWCLKTANRAASRSVLGIQDAAKFRKPGRAYIKIGEDLRQVQAFFAGAPYDPYAKMTSGAEEPITQVALNGTKRPMEEKTKIVSDRTEIEVVIEHIAKLCEKNGFTGNTRLWQPMLPERIGLDELLPAVFDGQQWPKTETLAPIIGWMDDPQRQEQYPLALELAKTGHIVIYGAPVTGKTTLLQTLIMSIALTRKPDETSIYIMDFGGWNLSVFRELPHVGGVANDNEPERINKLVLLLNRILEDRKQRFSNLGVGNISTYREVTGERLPDVVLVVDNFGPVLKMYPDLDAFFVTVTSIGANYGVYLVATAISGTAVPYKIQPNIKHTLALRMSDKSEYSMLVGKTDRVLPEIMGRGFEKGMPPREFQTALPVPGEDDKNVAANMRTVIKRMKAAWEGEMPAPIPEMPDTIYYGSVRTKGICLGLSTENVMPVCWDYMKQHYLVISGVDGSGKSNMLQVLARQMKEKTEGTLYAFDVRGSSLAALRDVADEYYSNAAEIDQFVESIRPELQSRHEGKRSDPSMRFPAIIIAIDDYGSFFEAVSNETIDRLKAIAKIGAGLGLYLLIAGNAYSLSSLCMKGETVVGDLVKAKQAVLLGGCINDHCSEFKISNVTYTQKNLSVKDYEGFFVCNGEAVRLKTMLRKGEYE